MSNDQLLKVDIYTDGACSGNPGPGGWGALIRFGEMEKEISGGEADTTNNRMEMRAVIEALKCLKQPCNVDLYTDSRYVQQGISGWLAGWKAKNWMTASKTPVKNRDLWEQLDAEVNRHKVVFHWVKGHAGHKFNERADILATSAVPSSR